MTTDSYPQDGTPNGLNLHESFSLFFEHWLDEQDRDLQSLRSAAAAHSNGGESTLDEHHIRSLVNRVLSHYENYYHVKHFSATQNVLPMFSPCWTSKTENLFLWIGGWRPSMAFHLLYSKSGLQLESQLSELISGLPTGDLADLSHSQLDSIDRLQRQMVNHERVITEELATVQETVADVRMVELSHALTEVEGGTAAVELSHALTEVEGGTAAVELSHASTEGEGEAAERMLGVLNSADQLRIETLKGVVVEILKPRKAVYFWIAAAELHLRIHEFGKNHDELSRVS